MCSGIGCELECVFYSAGNLTPLNTPLMLYQSTRFVRAITAR